VVNPMTTISLQALEGELIRQITQTLRNELQRAVNFEIEEATERFRKQLQDGLTTYVAKVVGEVTNTIQFRLLEKAKAGDGEGLQLTITFPKITITEKSS